MTAQTHAPAAAGGSGGSRSRSASAHNPSAVRRGSSLLLTAGLVGSGLALASAPAQADEDFTPQSSTNDVPLQHPVNEDSDSDEDATGGYGPEAELEDEDGESTEAGDYRSSEEFDFWAPDPDSGLLGTESPGNQAIGSSADSETGLFAGQSLRYEMQVDLSQYEALVDAYEGAAEEDEDQEDFTFEIRHTIPEGVEVDLDSVEFYSSSTEDGEGDSLLTGDDFSADIRGDNDDLLQITLDQDWLNDNLDRSTVYLVFNATVTQDAAQYAELSSQAYQQIQVPQPHRYEEVESDDDDDETEIVRTNEGERDTYRFYAEPASFQVLGADPDQQVSDTSGDPVGDRVAVGGDLLDFEVTLDGTLAGEVEDVDDDVDETDTIQEHTDPAYDIEDFGLVETFDPDLLNIDPDSVSVADNPGEYSVEVDNSSGELRIFAADPDDEWIGSDHTVNYQAVVQDVSEDASASVETTQVIDDAEFTPEETSSVEIAAIAPSKAAVVIDEDGEVTEVEEVEHESQFHYRVTSSETPENALYPVNDWGVIDELTRGDQSLHEDFEVRAETDITDSSGETVFAAGDVIDEDYFNLTASGDSYAVDARDSFTELIGDSEAQWSVYVAATRTANPGVDTSNTGIEVRNGADRSASLTTGTVAADDEDGSDEDPAELDLSLDVSSEVTQGETLEVSGSGFSPEAEVEVSLNPDEVFVTDEQGSFSGELDIAEDSETGERELVATDVTTGESVSAEVTVLQRSSDDDGSDDGSDEEDSSDSGDSGSGDASDGEGSGPGSGAGGDGSGSGSGSGSDDEDEDAGSDDEAVAAGTSEDGSSDSGYIPDGDPDSGDGELFTQRDGDVEPADEDADELDGAQAGSSPDDLDGDSATGNGVDDFDGEGAQQSQAGENLGATGASSPWLIGGGALLLLTAGAGAAYFYRLRQQTLGG